MISKMRTVVTKTGRSAGRRMGIVTLEDLQGQVEVILFPNDLERYQPLLVPESVAFFRGQVDRRRQEPSVRVSDVIPLEEADERLSAMVLVRLDSLITPECLREVAELARRYRGDRPLYLEVLTRDGMKVTIRGGQNMSVRPTGEFLQAMEELVGPERVEALPPLRVRAAPPPPEPAPAESAPPEPQDAGDWTDDAVDQLQTSDS
jgi:DNA polymerase-3 subunit alpha